LFVLCAASALAQNVGAFDSYAAEAAFIHRLREGSGDTLTDYSVNGRTATNIRNVAWAPWKDGAYFMEYAGSTLTNYTIIGTPSITGAITVAWVQVGNTTNTVTPTGVKGIIGNSAYDSWANIGYGIGQRTADNSIDIVVGNNGSSAGNLLKTTNDLSGTNLLSFVYTPATSLTFWINGVCIASQAVTRTYVNKGPQPWAVGREWREGSAYYHGGRIGMWMVIPRAFSHAESVALYATFTSTPPVTASSTRFSTVHAIYNLTTRGSIQ